MTERALKEITDAVQTIEGEDMPVRRALPIPALQDADPFLLLDHFGPVEIKPDTAGLPAHPHRGFETVTYMLEGRMEHRDSQGGHAIVGPGDVQWMTAGAGIVHAEVPPEEMKRSGGRQEGLQLWVNLPRAEKRARPGYQFFAARDIARYESADGRVTGRIIAGGVNGVDGPVATRFPLQLVHYTIAPGGAHSHGVPAGHAAFAYAFSGAGSVNGVPFRGAQIARFAMTGEFVEFAVPAAAEAPLSLLALAGTPLGEPVARYGPFVMNTREEIMEAFRDYQSGRMGTVAEPS